MGRYSVSENNLNLNLEGLMGLFKSTKEQSNNSGRKAAERTFAFFLLAIENTNVSQMRLSYFLSHPKV